MKPHAKVRGRRPLGGRRKRLILAIGLLLLIGFAVGGPQVSRAQESVVNISSPAQVELGGQSFFEDLTVVEGQTIDGDVVVWSGDVVVESGGTIGGGLVVWSGDIFIEEGGTVNGDVTSWSGDVEIDGHVGGNISSLNGDLELGDSATVSGDVSTFDGEIDRAESAQVGGNVVRGPEAEFPEWLFGEEGFSGFGGSAVAVPEAPDAPAAPEIPIESGTLGFVERLINLFLRMIGAVALTLFVSLAAAVVYAMRPTIVQRAQDGVLANPARTFALGISVNLALWLAVFIFSRAWCLAILALVPAILLIFVNAVGFAAVARIVGQRLGGALRAIDRRPILEVVLGALLIAAVLNFLPALFGGGSGIFFGLVALFVTAPGVGAFVQPWFDNYRNRRGRDLSSPGRPAPVPPVPPVAPVSPVAPIVPVAPVAPVVPVTPPVTPVTENIPLRREDASLTPVETPRSDAAPAGSSTLVVEDAPVAAAPETPYVFTLPEQPVSPPLDPGLSLAEVVSAADAEKAAADEATRIAREQAIDAAAAQAAGDDFTRIQGVGRSAERKLKASGITRFAQLAALPVEMIASILGVAVEEVIEDEILKQAAALAQS